MAKAEKVVVITGASSGIGRATALEFAKMGYTVVLGARREPALKALEEECNRQGGKAMAFPLDVTYEIDVKAMAKKTIEKFGHIDIWINNAAVNLMGKLEDTPMDDIRRVVDINLFGYIHGAKAVLPHFKEQKKGILINISSIVGLTGQPYSLAYTTSKFAVRGLSVSLQQELADEKDIHVCTVLPGIIDTPLFQQAGNYMGKELQPPGAALSAEAAAKEIAKLAKNPRKEILIGKFARISSPFTRLFSPNLYDKKYQNLIYQKHFTEEPAFPSKGNLYDPMREYASISGGWQHEKKSWPIKSIAIAGAIAAGAATGAFFLNRAAKKRAKKNEEATKAMPLTYSYDKIDL